MPECTCQHCNKNYTVWFTNNNLWNKYNNNYNFLCPSCFSSIAEQQGLTTTGWLLIPEENLNKTLNHVFNQIMEGDWVELITHSIYGKD